MSAKRARDKSGTRVARRAGKVTRIEELGLHAEVLKWRDAGESFRAIAALIQENHGVHIGKTVVSRACARPLALTVADPGTDGPKPPSYVPVPRGAGQAMVPRARPASGAVGQVAALRVLLPEMRARSLERDRLSLDGLLDLQEGVIHHGNRVRYMPRWQVKDIRDRAAMMGGLSPLCVRAEDGTAASMPADVIGNPEAEAAWWEEDVEVREEWPTAHIFKLIASMQSTIRAKYAIEGMRPTVDPGDDVDVPEDLKAALASIDEAGLPELLYMLAGRVPDGVDDGPEAVSDALKYYLSKEDAKAADGE